MSHKTLLLVSVLAVITWHTPVRGDEAPAGEKSVEQEAQDQANQNAAKRKAAMAKAKAHGVSAAEINQKVDAGYQDIISQQMDNPMFHKTPEELKAMGMNEKQIADIQKGKEAMPGYKKKLQGANKLTQEAISNPESERVKAVDKAALKNDIAKKRQDKKLGVKDAADAEASETKLNQQNQQSN